ncbi:uncharacterized protein LOC143365459 [Halictus rubicundus]|uniref:uncharacterized protein LOC143365459 n=1 Tax=Halictus rubicundus TaxID=77578 RepID=UPI004035B79A
MDLVVENVCLFEGQPLDSKAERSSVRLTVVQISAVLSSYFRRVILSRQLFWTFFYAVQSINTQNDMLQYFCSRQVKLGSTQLRCETVKHFLLFSEKSMSLQRTSSLFEHPV